MTDTRRKNLLKAIDLADKLDERDVDITKLFATALQAGYDLGKLAANPT